MAQPTEDKREPAYAWVLLAAITYIMILLTGQKVAYGLIYVELLDVYQVGPIRTTLITVVFSIFVALSGPVYGSLGDRFSARVLIMAAGLLACVGLLSSSFAPNVTILIFTYGITMGCSDAAFYSNALGIVNKYFQHNKGLANGIAVASGGVGTIVLSMLFQYLIETYSVRGLFIVAAGFWLNLCVIGAIIRPESRTTSTQSNGGTIHPDSLQTNAETKYCLQTPPRIDETTMKTASDVISISVISLNETQEHHMHATSPDSNSLSLTDQENPVNSCSRKEYQKSNSTHTSNTIKSICSLPFCVLLLTDFLACGAYRCTLMFIPAHLIDNGHGSSTGTLCLSLVGGMEMVGKLGFGYLGDRGILDFRSLLAICLLIGGVPMCVLAFNQPYRLLVFWCIVLGMFGETYEAFRGPILTSILGKRYLGTGFGMFNIGYGCATAVGPLIFSIQAEYMTGAYTSAFITSGCCMF